MPTTIDGNACAQHANQGGHATSSPSSGQAPREKSLGKLLRRSWKAVGKPGSTREATGQAPGRLPECFLQLLFYVPDEDVIAILALSFVMKTRGS